MVKDPSANAGDSGDAGLTPGSGRSPGEKNDNPFQYSCLENPKQEEENRGACWDTVYEVTKSLTQPSD